MKEKIYWIGIIILAFFLGYFIGKIIKYTELKKERKKTIKKSRSIILGESYEILAPFMKNINYHPKDMNFLGKGVDYVIFDGLSNGNLKQIVFLEIKTGKSRQNLNEKQIEKIIKDKKIKYEIVRW